jgi:hypothetical protein
MSLLPPPSTPPLYTPITSLHIILSHFNILISPLYLFLPFTHLRHLSKYYCSSPHIHPMSLSYQTTFLHHLSISLLNLFIYPLNLPTFFSIGLLSTHLSTYLCHSITYPPHLLIHLSHNPTTTFLDPTYLNTYCIVLWFY